MKFILSALLLCILLIVHDSNSLVINEVYPKSPEWVELYNEANENINISEWKIGDNVEIDGLTCHTIQNCSLMTNESFIIIIDKDTTISDITNGSVNYYYVDDSRIGNSINDNGDNLTLFDNNFNDSFGFNFSLNLKSWGKFPDGSRDFMLMNSSPGLPNSIENVSEETQSDANKTCDFGIRIECSEIFTEENHEYFLVTYGIENNFEHEVEYWIEDMFGKIVRSKVKTNNTASSKSWEPPIITGTEVYFIHAIIKSELCNDSNLSNNQAEKLIAVKGTAPIQNSEIEIKNVNYGSDSKAKFGDAIEVALNVYRGETAKSSIDVWVESPEGEKLAKTNFNTYGKFSNSSFSVPLQLNPNCDSHFHEDNYLIKAEGIDSYDEANIRIEGNSSLCKTKTIEISKACPSQGCQACKCENKSIVDTLKGNISKIADKNKTQEFEPFLSKTNISKALENISSYKNNSKSAEEMKIPTGKIVSQNEQNWLFSTIDGIINFFKNLFKL